MKKIVFIVLSLLCSMSAFAQETGAALFTERPSMSYGPGVLSKGRLQLETGAQYQKLTSADQKDKYWTYNTSLLRYGLLDNLELRLAWSVEEIKRQNLLSNRNNEERLAGFTPLTASFKSAITQGNGWVPQMAVIANLFLPFAAASDFETAHSGGQILLAFNNPIDELSGFTYNLSVLWDGDLPAPTYGYTFLYSRTLVGKLSGFAEVYGNYMENGRGENSWDTGISYLVTNNFQLDASFGTGFDTDQDYFINAGLSYRFN